MTARVLRAGRTRRALRPAEMGSADSSSSMSFSAPFAAPSGVAGAGASPTSSSSLLTRAAAGRVAPMPAGNGGS